MTAERALLADLPMGMWLSRLGMYAEVWLRPPKVQAEVGQIQPCKGEGRELVKGKKKPQQSCSRGFCMSHFGAYSLLTQPIEQRGDGDAMVGRGHFRSGLRAAWGHHFALSIPAAVERVACGLLTCGCMSCPPVFQLLVPALRLSGAANTDRGTPYGGLSIGVHHDLLCCVLLLWCAVSSTNRS